MELSDNRLNTFITSKIWIENGLDDYFVCNIMDSLDSESSLVDERVIRDGSFDIFSLQLEDLLKDISLLNCPNVSFVEGSFYASKIKTHVKRVVDEVFTRSRQAVNKFATQDYDKEVGEG